MSMKQQLREMNQALLVSSVRQHELAEKMEKADAAVRESEERYRTLFDLGPVAVYSCAISGVIQKFNRRAAELWGREPAFGDTDERFCGSFKLFRPDGGFMPHEQCPMAEVLSGKISGARDAEVLIERPDGSRVTVVVNIGPLKNQREEVTGAINCFYDITERKQAEEAAAHLGAIVTSSDDAIVSKNLQGIIRSWNKGAQCLFGYTTEEAIGKPAMLLIPLDRADEGPAILERIRRGEVVDQYETMRQHKDGSLLDISLTVSPLRDAAGRIIGASEIARDITERKRLSNELRQRNADLLESDRRKDEFLAMLSHELRNPLAPILNAVQLLRLQRDESEHQQRARTIIERQVGQLARLVDNLLEVSRISTGRIHLQRAQLDMRAIVECSVETVHPLIEQRRHALAVRLPPSPIWIDGDSTRLEQVVVNLLNNAAKYTDEGGHIWLDLQQEGNEAVLQVRDSGVGISPELLPHIFDLFTQAERSLARSQGGLGIGLCLVQRLVEMHGGKVAASSALGQGSEFVVRLPVVLPPVPQPASPPTEKAKPTGPSLRVLVVDDNVDTVLSFSMLLKESGHDVRTAHDGPTALEAACDYRPNVVLLDIGLPGLDGYQVAKRMRQQPVLQNVMLVAMTGYRQESDLQRSQEAGFDHHLVKPARFEQIQKILATALKKAT
jgi:PAS domain S-box-containing protein